MEGKVLTPTEMTDTNETAEQQPEAAHTHEHHDHDHEHEHHHAPTLNPELAREIEVEANADEVSKAFTNVVNGNAGEVMPGLFEVEG